MKNMEKPSPKITQFNFNFIWEVKKSNDVKIPIKEEDEKEIKITSDEPITQNSNNLQIPQEKKERKLKESFTK